MTFLKLFFSSFFFYIFWYLHTKFRGNDFPCPFSTKISIRNCTSWLIYFFEHKLCVRCRKPLKMPLIMLGDIQRLDFSWMLGMVFLWCTLNLHLSLILFVILILKKFNHLLWFPYYIVYRAARFCLFKICKKLSVSRLDKKRAWLSPTHCLMVFGIFGSDSWLLCVVNFADNFQVTLLIMTIKEIPMGPAFFIIKFQVHGGNNIHLHEVLLVHECQLIWTSYEFWFLLCFYLRLYLLKWLLFYQ